MTFGNAADFIGILFWLMLALALGVAGLCILMQCQMYRENRKAPRWHGTLRGAWWNR